MNFGAAINMTCKKIIVRRLLAVCSTVAILCVATVESSAAVLVIDNFEDSFSIDPGLSAHIATSNAVAGSRYLNNNAFAESRRAFSFATVDGALTKALHIHGYGPGVVQLVYGQSSPLNLNFLDYTDLGDPDNIFIRGYARTDDAQDGITIGLTLFDGTQSHTIYKDTYFYADLLARKIEWDVNEFKDNGVDITTVDRMTFTFSGIVNDGDIYFGILNAGAIPEPGTLVLLGLASVMVYALRRNHSAADLRS